MHVPGGAVTDYRDFTVVIADDDPQIGQDFMPYPTNANVGTRSSTTRPHRPVTAPPRSGTRARCPWLTAYAGDPTVVTC